MKTISNQEGEHIDTRGGSGRFGWPWWDDHKYTGSEWTQIEGAVNDERPVTASTSGGTVSDDRIDADTNNDKIFDDRDQGGDYRISKKHVYTVEGIDSEYVTLINPWARNEEASNGDRIGIGGRIRITREEYEKYFPETDIAQKTP